MKFRTPSPIFIQIAQHIIQLIISENWKEGDRIPSVRDLAAEIEVNPNTVVRAYNLLSQQGIVFNKRGVGYFLHERAKSLATTYLKQQFMNNELPYLLNLLDVLDLNFEDLKRKHDEKN